MSLLLWVIKNIPSLLVIVKEIINFIHTLVPAKDRKATMESLAKAYRASADTKDASFLRAVHEDVIAEADIEEG